MDLKTWKRILLQWITQCGFMEKNYFNIEQSDIEQFFQKFQEHINPGVKRGKDLSTFIAEHYPNFEPHFDDENALSSADYIYVYSILLHFGCVKHPEEFFHKLCQSLREETQQCIAIFFKELLETTHISKETLRNAIAGITNSPNPNDDTMSRCASMQSPRCTRVESPAKNVNRPQRISPTTPKTFMLEERTRELYHLRAQLETERYEKGLLEVQIKQNEDKITKLNQEQKKLQSDVKSLKNDLLMKSTENSSPTKMDADEQKINRRLCKKISENQEEISKLSDIVSSLTEENSCIEEKLKYSKKQVLTCMEKIKELDYKVDELTKELEVKNANIEFLTNNKLELEQFISETRSASANFRSDLNVSVDCLDMSFSQATTNSSGSLSSPENLETLGCSVIDVQLREKEYENMKLREDIDAIQMSNSKLAKHIRELMAEYSTAFEICSTTNLIVNDDSGEPAESFVIFANYVDKLSTRYLDQKNEVKKLQDESHSVQAQNDRLKRRVDELEAGTNAMRNHINVSEKANATLQASNKELQLLFDDCKLETHTITEQKRQIAACLDKLQEEFDAFKIASESSNAKSSAEIDAYRLQLDEKTQQNATLEATNLALQTEADRLQSNIEELTAGIQLSCSRFELEKNLLSDSLAKVQAQLKQQQQRESDLRQQYEKLLIECAEYKEVGRHLQTVRQNLATKEKEMSTLGDEIAEVKLKNASLQNRINSLTSDYRSEKEKFTKEIQKRDDKVKALRAEKEQLEELNKQQAEVTQEEINKSKAIFQEKLDEVMDKNNSLKNQLEENNSLVKLLQNEIKESEEKIAYIENELHRNNLQLAELSEEKDAALRNVDNLNGERSKMVENLASTEDKLRATLSEKDSLEINVRNHNATISDLKQKLSDSQQKTDAILNETKVQLQSKEDEIAKLEKNLDEKTVELQKTKACLKDLSNQIQNDTRNRQMLEEQMQILEKAHESKLIESERKIQQILLKNSNAIAEYEKKNEEASAERATLLEKLNASVNEHKKAQKLLEDKIKVISDEKETLNQQLKTARSNQMQLNEKRIATQNKAEELNKECAKLLQQLEQITSDKSLADHRIAELQKEVETISLEKEELKAKQDQLLEEENKMKKLLIEMETAIQQLQSDAETMTQEISELRTCVETLEQTKSDQSSVIKDLNEKLASQTTKLLSVSAEKDDLLRTNKKQETHVTDLEKSFQEKSKTCCSLQNELKDAELKLQNSIEESREREIKIRSDQEENAALLRSLETTSDQLKLAIEEKETQQQEKASILRSLEETSDRLKQAVDEKESQQKEKASLLRSLEETSDRLKQAIEEKEDQQKEKDALLRSVEVTSDRLKLAIEEKEDQQKEKEALLRSLEETSDRLKLVIEENESQLKEKTALLRSLEEIKNRLKQAIEEREAQQDENANLLRSLEDTSDQLKQAIEEKDIQSKQLTDSCEKLRLKVTTVSEQNKRLHDEIAAKESEILQQLEKFTITQEEQQWRIDELSSNLENKSQQLSATDSVINAFFVFMEENGYTVLDEATMVKNIFGATETTCTDSLKQRLNLLVHNFRQLQKGLSSGDKQIVDLSDTVNELTKQNFSLVADIARVKDELTQLQENIGRKVKSLEIKHSNEVKRLRENLQNIEDVCDRLTNENVSLQTKLFDFEEETKRLTSKNIVLAEENAKLVTDQQEQMQIVAKLSDAENALNKHTNQLQTFAQELQAQIKVLQENIQAKSEEAIGLLNERNTTTEQLQKFQAEANTLQANLQKVQSEAQHLNEKCSVLKVANDSLEIEISAKQNEIVSLRAEISNMQSDRSRIEEDLHNTAVKLTEAIDLKLVSESKFELLFVKSGQTQRNLEMANNQLANKKIEIEKLSGDLRSLTAEKSELAAEIKDFKREIARQTDNVSQLIKQIDSIRLEKDAVNEEKLLLSKQLNENSKTQSTSETKLKTSHEQSQSLERSLLSVRNELKVEKSRLLDAEEKLTKIAMENKKLKETNETSNRRIEKQALKLGDCQAKCSKLERETETLRKNLTCLEGIQRDNLKLQCDCKSLRDRLARGERLQEQYLTKIESLDAVVTELKAKQHNLVASEIELKDQKSKLEKMRELSDEKIRKLTNRLSELTNLEQEKVRLNLEVGALNSELVEQKRNAATVKSSEVEVIANNLIEAKNKANQLGELNEKLLANVNELREENSRVTDELSKVELRMRITQEEHKTLESEVQQLRTGVDELRREKESIENNHQNTLANLKEFEMRQKELLTDRQSIVVDLEVRIERLHKELDEKSEEITNLRQQLDEYRSRALTKSDVEEELRTRLTTAEDLVEAERKTTKQLLEDNAVFQAKYYEAKERLVQEIKLSEERIKENRLELEGKLEKMKNKMKTLYNEETTKLKKKQERDMAIYKSEMDVIKTQNEKFEAHTAKLSKQLFRLNENMLECQKQNTFLKTKLKNLESTSYESMMRHQHQPPFKRPNTIHVSSTSSSSAAAATSSNHSSNLAMEDEEGEIFNNTYLADLQSGRISEYFGRDVCVEELQHRNSLLPPHLKSTYAAQYIDHGMSEDDLKDGGGMPNLDDSMSALLSTTTGGTRKKTTGSTSYRRPGPPTPSKNAGRLSFGRSGSCEPAREILQETHDCSGNIVSSSSSCVASKTPAKFKLFTSRFSMGSKDEYRNSLRVSIYKKNQQTKQLFYAHTNGETACSSTPRKSTARFDQRRLLDQLMSSASPSPSAITDDQIVSTTTVSNPYSPPERDVIATPKHNNSRHRRRVSFSKWRQPNKLYTSIESSDDTCSPAGPLQLQAAPPITTSIKKTTMPNVTKSSIVRCGKLRPSKERRVSICLRGNIFAKSRNPNRSTFRDLYKRKAKHQRNANFNQYRTIPTTPSSTPNSAPLSSVRHDIKNNNNYANINRNKISNEEEVLLLQDEGANKPIDPVGDHDENAVSCNVDLPPIDKATCDLLLMSESHDDLEQDHLVADDNQSTNIKEHFQQLLSEKESHAPFEVTKIQFGTSLSSQQCSSMKTSSANNSTISNATSITSPFHLTGGSQSSRTIYGCSFIYNRKIPNVDATIVRKSSIYVKSDDPNQDIILVTNQTITLIDIARMWKQMNVLTQISIVFGSVASLAAILFVVLNFFT